VKLIISNEIWDKKTQLKKELVQRPETKSECEELCFMIITRITIKVHYSRNYVRLKICRIWGVIVYVGVVAEC